MYTLLLAVIYLAFISLGLPDSLLGAAALGDIGKHFPDTDPAYAGISSLKLLREVGKLLREKGYVVVNADVVLLAQAPKVGPYRQQMAENLAAALEIDVEQMNVKATTEEGLGFTGSGAGISSQAICALSTMKEYVYSSEDSDVQVGACGGCKGCRKDA